MSVRACLALVLVLLPLAAGADEAKLPLTLDPPVADGGVVKVSGTSAAGATVSLHAQAGCKGAAAATATTDDAGRFAASLKATAVSARAAAGDQRSDCVDAPKAAAPAKGDDGMGICIGLATRCGVLPKGICFTQQGCMNPIGSGGFGNDRCLGEAKPCTSFNTKNSCYMQRGCTWAPNKKK